MYISICSINTDPKFRFSHKTCIVAHGLLSYSLYHMPRSKTRKKTYKPRQVKVPGIIDNLPVPPVMLKKLTNDMDNRILRLRFAGNNGKDLAALVMYYATAWLLAGEMDNGQELRDKLEAGVRELGKAILASTDAVQGPMYDTILDLTALTTAVVGESTKGEYKRASESLKAEGNVPFADEFLVTLAQAGLLQVVNASKDVA